MSLLQILLYPSHKVILECTFDYLMKQIWCDELMDISPWKIIRKRLKYRNESRQQYPKSNWRNKIRGYGIHVPQDHPRGRTHPTMDRVPVPPPEARCAHEN